jgi:hypothetical protein
MGDRVGLKRASVLAARFVVGGRNGGYWTNIHELTS